MQFSPNAPTVFGAYLELWVSGVVGPTAMVGIDETDVGREGERAEGITIELTIPQPIRINARDEA